MSEKQEEYFVSEEHARQEKIVQLKRQAIDLRNNIKRNQKIIDNPSLSRSTIDELDFFIENVEEEEY